MKNYISSFCKKYEYPEDATATFLHSYDTITQNKKAYEIFGKLLDNYECNKEIFNFLDEVAQLSGIHKYTVHLLYHICLSRHTKKLYEEKQISDKIFFDSMSDMKCKLRECYTVYGIWGSFSREWLTGFFNLSRFALGRLQYETIEFPYDYTKNGHTLKKGDIVLNMHIPSSGPLHHQDCLDSYKMAAEFFKEHFVDRPTAFVCNSWLLFPEHKKMLPENSNIRKFMNDFDIISSKYYEDYEIAWRIFNTKYTGNLADLPRDTSLQKIYWNWLNDGNKMGSGFGVFLFDDNII